MVKKQLQKAIVHRMNRSVSEPYSKPMNEERSLGARLGAFLKRIRWWIPAAIVALAIANRLRIRFSAELDGNTKGMQTALTLLVAVVLLVLWFAFFSRLRWRIRIAGILLFGIFVFGLTRLLRFDGAVNGNGSPKIVWQWKEKRTGNVGPLQIIASSAATNADLAVGDDSGYLGPNRNGILETLSLNRDWTAQSPKQLWRQPVGLGWSSFAVSGQRALTQEQRGENELVICYELTSGLVLWAHTNHVRFSEPLGGDGPRATPTITGGRVYAVGGTGILDCLDGATGKLIWSRDTLKENSLPNLPFGKSCSPLVFDDLVVVTGGETNGSTLLAYHLNDGSPAWRAGTDKASFSSPTLVTLAGKRQIVAVNAGSVTGHDPSCGAVLWTYSWKGEWPKCAQPVVLPPDRIFVAASFNAGCLLLQLSANPDGKFSVTEKWKNRNMKSEFSNIVARDGYAYGLDDGILACVDLSTGERKWKDGHYGHGHVLLVGDLLLIQTEQGPVALVEAKPSEFKELGNFAALQSKTWNVPAVADGFLLVRNDQDAACYKLPLLKPLTEPRP
jgi:outer membrane protein assembly factor BamB